jgi:hypothetical protein
LIVTETSELIFVNKYENRDLALFERVRGLAFLRPKTIDGRKNGYRVSVGETAATVMVYKAIYGI